jgi:hypothetical protein
MKAILSGHFLKNWGKSTDHLFVLVHPERDPDPFTGVVANLTGPLNFFTPNPSLLSIEP